MNKVKSNASYVKRYFQNPDLTPSQQKRLGEDLGEDFQTLLDNHQGNITWDAFRAYVDQLKTKFWSLNNKKPGVPFSPNFWSAIYATQVSPRIKEYFPEIWENIQKKKGAIEAIKD